MNSKRNLFVMWLAVILVISFIAYFLTKKVVVQKRRVKFSKNIVLISIDTLRADHLSCYGYSRLTSPNIDKFAKKGVLFRNAISQSDATLPSHSSIFTSRYPSQHKTIKQMNFYVDLAESEIALAEVLKKYGYTTAAFTDGGEMSIFYNIDQGFDIYNDAAGHIKHINPRVFRWLEKNRDKRFFLFVHCYDCHRPYEPPFPFCKKFLSKFDKNIYQDVCRVFKKGKTENKNLLEKMVALYDGEIAYTDKHMGKLFRKLDKLGLTEKTLIILTSDHGEQFMEHSGLGHGETVYDEEIKVPLIFKNENLFQPKEIDSQVRSIDIAPTILDILNIPIPDKMMGKSLLKIMHGETEITERLAISENEQRDKVSCRSMNYKFIRNKKYNAGPMEEFYDLQSDSKEQNNLFVNTKGIYSEFIIKMFKWEKIVESSAQPDRLRKELDENKCKKHIEELKALGYL